MDADMIRRLRKGNDLDRMAARVLDTAAHFVSRGWCQGREATTRQHYPSIPVSASPRSAEAACWCASAALLMAQDKLGLRVPGSNGSWIWRDDKARRAADRASFALRAVIGGGEAEGISIPNWNDSPWREKADVLEAFKQGAGTIRERIEVVQRGIREATANG
jgi:hypothetical protein